MKELPGPEPEAIGTNESGKEVAPANAIESEQKVKRRDSHELAVQRANEISAYTDEVLTTPAHIEARVLNVGGSTAEIDARTEEEDTEILRVSREARELIERLPDKHPALDIFRDPKALEKLDLNELRTRVKEMRLWQREFNDRFDKAISGTENRKEQGAKAAELLTEMQQEKLTAGQTATFFATFKEAGDFSGMISLYEKSNSVIFRDSQVVREQMAVALHKVGELEKSEAMIQELIKDGKESGEMYAILGKIHKKRAGQLSAEDPVKGAEALRQSTEFFEKGYKVGFEAYPGVNVVYNRISEGISEGDPDKMKHHGLTPVVSGQGHSASRACPSSSRPCMSMYRRMTSVFTPTVETK